MNSRELDQAFVNVKELLGIEVDLNSDNAIQQIEQAIIARGYLSEEKVTAFTAAKQKDGKYIINPEDNELIKAVKATINLLVAVNTIDHKVLDDLQNYVDAEENKLERIKKLFKLGVTVVKGVDQLKQFRQDMNVFLFYLGRFNSLMTDFAGIQAAAYTKIQDLQDAFANLEINHVKKVVDKKLEKAMQEKLDRPIPSMNGANEVYQAITAFGLRLNIQALVQITDSLSIANDKDYDSQQKRFAAPVEDFKVIYNLCHDVNDHIVECEKLLRKIADLYPQIASLKWSDLSESERGDFVKLDTNLKTINANLSRLIPLCDKYPLLKKISDRNADFLKQQRQALSDWAKSPDSENIAKLSSGAEDALVLVNEVIDNNITQAMQVAYFNPDQNLYAMPQDSGVIPDTQLNLMLLYNIDVRAKAVLSSLDVAKNKSFPGNVFEMMNVLNAVGELVADFKKLKQEILLSDGVALLRRDLQAVFGQAIGMLRAVAVIAAEAELRLNLADHSLLNYLDPLSDTISKLLGLLSIQMITPQPPYKSEREEAANNISKEVEYHQRILRRAKKALTSEPRTLVKMIKCILLLDQTGLYSASIYAEKLREQVDQLLGVDVLEAEIKSRESSILKAVQQQEMMASQSLLLAKSERIHAMNFSNEIKAKIKQLRQLYGMRDNLRDTVQEISAAKSRDKLTNLPINHFEIVTEGFFVKNSKYQLVEGVKSLSDESTQQSNLLHSVVVEELNSQLPDNLDRSRTENSSLFMAAPIASDESSGKSLTESLLKSDETRFLTATSVDLALEEFVLVEEMVPLDDTDYLAVQAIVDKAKGSLILNSEAARQQLIEKFSPMLAEDINNLSPLGTYVIGASDKPLMAAVKSIYNAMVAFERLMLLVNKLQRVLGGDYLGYRKIPGLITNIKNAAKSLKDQVIDINSRLTVLRELVMTHAIHLDAVNPFSTFESSLKQFYDQFQGLGLVIQSGLIGKLLPDLVGDVGKWFTYASKLEASSNSLIKSVTSEVENELALSVRLNKSISTDASVKELVDWAKKQLSSHIADTSYRDSIAALVDAYDKLIFAMNGADNYAHGHPITGLFSVISNLCSAWSLINQSNVMNLADNAKHHAATEFLRLKNLLNKKIEDCIGQVSPMLSRMRQEVALSEQSLGLKEGVSLKPLDDYLKKFNQLVAGYGVPLATNIHPPAHNREMVPLMDAEDSRLFTPAPELTESALNAYMGQNSVNKELNEKKIRALVIACVEYKHHLAEALNKELLSALPHSYYYVDLDGKFTSLNAVQAKLDPVLKLTIEKYNAVHELQLILQSPRSNNQHKLTDFSNTLHKHQELISESRTSQGMAFLKVVATILSAGFATLFGLWNVRGKQVADRMNRILFAGGKAEQPKRNH